MRIEDKYMPLLQAVLDKIRKELDRLYWNKYQKEMDSPFDNTGNMYSNEVFSVRAYDWGELEPMERLPNFSYKNLEVRWYKHSNRGTMARCDKELTAEYLVDMLDDCINSLRRDFGEEEY